MEDPPMLLFATLTALTLVVLSLAFPHPKDRRLVRLRLAQEK